MQKNTLKDEYVSYVFLHMAYDLLHSLEKKSWYSRLHCARLLRLFLLDKDSKFLGRISEITGIEPHFVTTKIGGPTQVGLPSYVLLPDLSKVPPGVGYNVMTKDEYLDHSVGVVAGRNFTVENVINRVGYKLGGLHLQKVVEGELEQDLLAAESLVVFGESFFAHSVRFISNTTLMAINPLRDELQKRHPELRDEIIAEYKK